MKHTIVKLGSNSKTVSFVAMRTKLFIEYSLTHAEGMESIGFESVSLNTPHNIHDHMGIGKGKVV